jgi:phage-related protein
MRILSGTGIQYPYHGQYSEEGGNNMS